MTRQNQVIPFNRLFLIVAALNGFLSVALGAFGAHGLKKLISPSLLQTFQTGVDYQLLHTLALLAIALLPQQNRWSSLAGWGFISGIILFSGSLYLLALLQTRALGLITPIGGMCFLIGWACLFIYAWKHKTTGSQY